jgi:hypothetical protein
VDKNDYIKSIEICQGIISRMASNSSNLKVWFLVTFSALFTYFSKSDSKVWQDVIWILPMLMFVWLDAFYLRQERIFRLIHDDFEKSINEPVEKRKPFHLVPTQTQLGKYNIWNCIFSPSVAGFYFILLIAFQFFILYRTLPDMKWATGVFPFLLLLLAIFFNKPTDHSKGA